MNSYLYGRISFIHQFVTNIFLRSCNIFTWQVLDVDRMIVKTTTPSSKDHGMLGMENHPVIRTLYDHVEVGAILFSLLSLTSQGFLTCFTYIITGKNFSM